jgi:hypothetical protein
MSERSDASESKSARVRWRTDASAEPLLLGAERCDVLALDILVPLEWRVFAGGKRIWVHATFVLWLERSVDCPCFPRVRDRTSRPSAN